MDAQSPSGAAKQLVAQKRTDQSVLDAKDPNNLGPSAIDQSNLISVIYDLFTQVPATKNPSSEIQNAIVDQQKQLALATTPEQQIPNLYTIAILYQSIGDHNNYQRAKQNALDAAHNLPTGEIFAYPVMSGDFSFLEGDFSNCRTQYEKVIKTLREGDTEVETAALDSIKPRLEKIYQFEIAEAMRAFEVKPNEATANIIIERFENLYRLEPTSEYLRNFIYAYSAVGHGLDQLQRTIKENEELISMYERKGIDALVGTVKLHSTVSGRHNEQVESVVNDVRELVESSDVSLRSLENQILIKTLVDAISRIETAISESNIDDPQLNNLQIADLYAATGDIDGVKRALESAHEAYELRVSTGREVPRSAIINEITTLHRLIPLAGIDHEKQAILLKTASEEIKRLELADNKSNSYSDDWRFYYLEHANIEAGLNEENEMRKYHQGDGKKVDQLFRDIEFGYNRAVAFGVQHFQQMTSPSLRAQFSGQLLEAQHRLYGKQLEHLRWLRISQESTPADILKKIDAAYHRSNDFSVQYGHWMGADSLALYQNERDWAYASALFNSGEFALAVAQLEKLLTLPDSSKIKQNIIQNLDEWPRKYNLINELGDINSQVGTTDYVEGIKVALATLDKKQGSLAAGCGVGMGAAAVGSLLVGEKLSGASYFAMCLGGMTVERGAQMYMERSAISQASTIGASNVSQDDALNSLKSFVMQVGTVAVGGAVGRIAQQAVRGVGLWVKSEALQLAVARKALDSAWLRSSSGIQLAKNIVIEEGFFIREGAFAANAYATLGTIHKLNEMQASDNSRSTNAPRKNLEPLDYLTVWMFVRFMPFFYDRVNVGGRITKGSSLLDNAGRFTMNSAVAVGGIHAALATTTDRKFSVEEFSNTLKYILILRGASKAIEMTLNSSMLSQLAFVKLSRVEKPKAESSKSFTNAINSQYASMWGIRRVVQSVVHAADFVAVTTLFSAAMARNVIRSMLLSRNPSNNKKRDNETRTEAEILGGQQTLYSSSLFAQGSSNPSSIVRSGFKNWLVYQYRAASDTFKEISNTPWKHFINRDAATEAPSPFHKQLYLEAAKQNIPPWQRINGRFNDEAINQAAIRLSATAGKDSSAFGWIKPKSITPDFIPHSNWGKFIFSANRHGINSTFGRIGNLINKSVKETDSAIPRFAASRRIAMARKELMREVDRPTLTDPPKWLNVFWDTVIGPERISRREATAADRSSAWNLARTNGTKNALDWAQKFRYNFEQNFYPIFQAAHGVGLVVAAADLLLIDGDDDGDRFDIDTQAGAWGLVLGSNLLAAEMGITTQGGALISALAKTITWGMLVSMEGSDPIAYFSQKPQDIVKLHIEYFSKLLCEVAIFSGMHSRVGNPIYSLFTNLPFLREIPSLSTWGKLFTGRSTMYKPEFVGAGRWLSLGYSAPFQALSGYILSNEKYLDANAPYTMAHRVAKTLHLGLWLKPLGAKLGQAGTLGQFVERLSGLGVDWVHGLIMPVKSGKGGYENRLIDNLTSWSRLENSTTTIMRQESAGLTHEIFRKATRSLDVGGWLGNAMAKTYDLGTDSMEPRFGWRVEIKAVNKHVEIMENHVAENPSIAKADARAFDYILRNYNTIDEVDRDEADHSMALVVRAMEQKMFAERGKTNGDYRAYGAVIHSSSQPKSIRKFWDSIPTPTTAADLDKYVQQINDRTLDANALIQPLIKKVK